MRTPAGRARRAIWTRRRPSTSNQIIGKWFKEIRPGRISAAGGQRVHLQLLREHLGADRGAQGGRGNISGDQKKLQDALAQISLNAPYGKITLDDNRQAITDQYYLQLVEGDKGPATKTVGNVPDVDQTFGGMFSENTPAPGRTDPPCEKRDIPWLGKTEKPKVIGG